MNAHRVVTRSLGLLLVFVLAGCSGATTSTTTPTQAPVTAVPPATPAATPAQTPAAATPTVTEAATPVPATETPAASATAVTIEEWSWYNGDPGLGLFQAVADEYHAAHPDVTIHITTFQPDDLTQKVQAALNAGNPPDMWVGLGGGRLAAQVTSGKIRDLTADVAPWIGTLNAGASSIYQIDGKQYGIPFDLGITGFWYNKALFTQAGISAAPATWDDFIADIGKLKAANITPIAIGEKDQWPGMFFWALAALRAAGKDAMLDAVNNGNWDTPAFVQAGTLLKQLVDANAFQKGFLGSPETNDPNGAPALMANRKAAMELMGHWEPSSYVQLSADGKGLGADLGWFPFPTVPNGAGQITDAFGGGNGWVVSASAPPETIDYLKYFSSPAVANRWGSMNLGLPVVEGTDASVTDANLKELLGFRAAATYVQLYLDEATAPAVGKAINASVAELFAATSTPKDVAAAIQDAAKSQ
jgi:raffinose/stachyose/melibiose transport system substrate-binding protein